MSDARRAVVMLHSVVPDAELDTRLVPRPRQELGTEELRRFVQDARAAGWSIVGLADLLDGPAPGGPRLAVTFDDGYRDFADHALPVLRALDVPATLFVTTGYPDRTLLHVSLVVEDLVRSRPVLRLRTPDGPRTVECHDRVDAATQVNRIIWEAGLDTATEILGDYREEWVDHGLTWEQLHEIARDPLTTIGGHTTSHPFLPTLDPQACAAEVDGNRRRLRAELGVPVEHFAYPFGRHSDTVVQAVRRAGYTAAVTTEPRDVATHDARHLLPRFCAESGRPFAATVDA